MFAINIIDTRKKSNYLAGLYTTIILVMCNLAIVRSRSSCGWAGLNEIKALSTHVLYVTIVIMRNMCAQLLTFQNDVFSQDSCYSVITRFYRIIAASGMILRLL